MTSKDIFDQGYAIPSYDIQNEVRHWRYREETYSLPWNAVVLRQIDGLSFFVGGIEDIRNASKQVESGRLAQSVSGNAAQYQDNSRQSGKWTL